METAEAMEEDEIAWYPSTEQKEKTTKLSTALMF